MTLATRRKYGFHQLVLIVQLPGKWPCNAYVLEVGEGIVDGWSGTLPTFCGSLARDSGRGRDDHR
jgi:hypothetical protein